MNGGETETAPFIWALVQPFVEAATVENMVAIGIGLTLGIVVVLFTRKGTTDDFDSELTDLEERKDHAVAQLRELESHRDRIDPDTYEQQRAEQEQIAADAMRARDQLLKKRRTSPAGIGHDQPVLRALVWGGGIVFALGIAWLIVSPDEIPPPGAIAHAKSPVIDNPELAEVWKRLKINPADIDALIDGATILASTQRYDEASQYIDRALQLDPDHPGALVQYAALLAARGRPKEGLARLDSLVEKHPDFLEAWSLRGMVAMQTGDTVKARASLGEYMKRAPDGPAKEQVRAMFEGIR